MSAPTINGNRPADTVSDGLRGCVQRASGPGTADSAESGPESAFTPVHVHAISPDRADRQANAVGNFASRHIVGVKAAVDASWPLTETPVPLAEAARTVLPAKGEAGNWVVWVWFVACGLFRLAVVALCTLGIAAVAGEPRPYGRTRHRAGVFLLIFAALTAAHLILR